MEDVEIGTGIAFPFGSAPAAVKAFEVEDAVRRGCTAVDMVMNIGALKSGDTPGRRRGTAAVQSGCRCGRHEVHSGSVLPDRMNRSPPASKLVAEAGIDFVKTSSGQFEGPSLEQFLVMRDAVRDAPVRLKVAGVKFPRPQNALVFLRAGADRIGTRAAPEIVDSAGDAPQRWPGAGGLAHGRLSLGRGGCGHDRRAVHDL
jgi:deoxyribose-phosphate aldolase